MNFKKISIAVVAALTFLTVQTVNAQTVSDADLKKNEAPLTNSLSFVEQLKPLSFEFDTNKFKQLNLPAGTRYGFNAQEVQQILPGLITTKHKWYNAGKNNQRTVATQEVNYEALIPLLVGAIKEQQAEIAELRANIQQLKTK